MRIPWLKEKFNCRALVKKFTNLRHSHRWCWLFRHLFEFVGLYQPLRLSQCSQRKLAILPQFHQRFESRNLELVGLALLQCSKTHPEPENVNLADFTIVSFNSPFHLRSCGHFHCCGTWESCYYCRTLRRSSSDPSDSHWYVFQHCRSSEVACWTMFEVCYSLSCYLMVRHDIRSVELASLGNPDNHNRSSFRAADVDTESSMQTAAAVELVECIASVTRESMAGAAKSKQSCLNCHNNNLRRCWIHYPNFHFWCRVD